MSTLKARIAELESENETIADEYADVVDKLNFARADIDRLNSEQMHLARALDEASTWRDRASAAEDELTALRKELREFVASMRDVTKGGPVDYRRRIADRLERILGA